MAEVSQLPVDESPARHAPDETAEGRWIAWLAVGVFALLGGAGGVLWWRDGERLFTEGLISAIARCF